MEKMAELKPCPFCGGEAFAVNFTYAITEGHWKMWSVDCPKCRCQSGDFVTKEEAIEAWNRRAE